MFERDFSRFTQLLDDAFSLNPNWKPLGANGKALFFRALELYPFDAVSKAMTAHIRDPQRGKFQPAPADLIAQIEAAQGAAGRPGVDEAWAQALAAVDEAETVVWTEETAAAFAACRPVLNTGDKIGARMAFKDAYTRLVTEANRQHKPVKWQVSLGTDAGRRTEVISKAQVAGLLPAAQAQALLPAPAFREEVDHAGLARLKAELAKLVPADEKMAQRRAEKIRAEQHDVATRKAELAQRVAAYHGGKHAVAS
ncbi:MAG TPA: hypothetical protein VIM12_05800 [Noviherbaspirillum sp.]|jgi:hypothetical protein|uniref:hypothetical protein n=1 Tax=Noviherbaspirillum sp. TaxID=1926288 RepID=UPI002F91D66F